MREGYLMALVCSCGSWACSPTETSPHLEVRSHGESQQLCAGDLARYEAMLVAYEDRLGRDLQTPVKLDVWHPSEWPAHAFWKCGPSRGLGCYVRSSHHIYSSSHDIVVAHELVHAVARNTEADDPLFVEGVADALSRATEFGDVSPTLGLSNSEVYRFAGHFVRWLWETRGPECVRPVLWSDAKDVAAVFESACGSSFEDARDEYAASAPWRYPSFAGCDETDWVLDDGLDESIDFDCDDPSVRGQGTELVTTRVLEVDTPGLHHVWTSAAGVSLGSCAREVIEDAPSFHSLADRDVPPEWAAESRYLAGGRVHVLELPQGRVALTLTTSRDAPTQRVIITPADSTLPVGVF